MIAMATATTLAVSYGFLSVYAFHNVDGKFGAAGTVQLLGLMAAISASVAAVGSSLFHFLWLRRTRRVRPAVALWSGVFVGSLLALVHKHILFHAPLLPGVSDWQQQCLYFVVLGYVLHWAFVPLIEAVGAQ